VEELSASAARLVKLARTIDNVSCMGDLHIYLHIYVWASSQEIDAGSLLLEPSLSEQLPLIYQSVLSLNSTLRGATPLKGVRFLDGSANTLDQINESSFEASCRPPQTSNLRFRNSGGKSVFQLPNHRTGRFKKRQLPLDATTAVNMICDAD
jgi:hypothetical protein